MIILLVDKADDVLSLANIVKKNSGAVVTRFEPVFVDALRRYFLGWKLTELEEGLIQDFMQIIGPPEPTKDPERLRELLDEACEIAAQESVDYKRLNQIAREAGLPGR